MKLVKLTVFFLVAIIFSACETKSQKKIIIANTLGIARNFDTVELKKDLLGVEDLESIGIKDTQTNELVTIQTVDNDGDGVLDVILFQPKILANSEKTYDVVHLSEGDKPENETYCYSRFVPERTDDYAWENNKVAFRVFGPDAQFRYENNLEQPTLTSGVDAWLKKVEYPIINSWYKKTTEKTGSYHEDTGEGLDNFHVGRSRGVGGIAIKQDTTYYYSKNFTKWRTITTGPIRTSFYLEYENWDAGASHITERKVISLDYGSNLSKFEINISRTEMVSAGLTLHEKDGRVTTNNKNAWVSYWEPHGNSELGTAIITYKKHLSGFENYITEDVDLSNVYIHLNVLENKVIYYAGFGWKESNQFKNKNEWESYLNHFSERIKNPLIVKLQ